MLKPRLLSMDLTRTIGPVIALLWAFSAINLHLADISHGVAVSSCDVTGCPTFQVLTSLGKG